MHIGGETQAINVLSTNNTIRIWEYDLSVSGEVVWFNLQTTSFIVMSRQEAWVALWGSTLYRLQFISKVEKIWALGLQDNQSPIVACPLDVPDGARWHWQQHCFRSQPYPISVIWPIQHTWKCNVRHHLPFQAARYIWMVQEPWLAKLRTQQWCR